MSKKYRVIILLIVILLDTSIYIIKLNANKIHQSTSKNEDWSLFMFFIWLRCTLQMKNVIIPSVKLFFFRKYSFFLFLNMCWMKILAESNFDDYVF